jgi:double-stranded uracil-DNA glycosylase
VLPDILATDLTVVFVGTAKSTTSARSGHYYASPQNMFWNLLQATGLTEGKWLTSSEDRRALEYGVGLTDLVPNRAASSDAELRHGDYDVAAFIQKVERFEPMIVAFNGEKAATKAARHLEQAPIGEGPAAWRIGDSLIYRLPSSSSANASGGYAVKRAKWAEFGQWVAAQH